MAEKGGTERVATAAAAAAGTGAAQLGLGYGLGVVVWPVAATPDDSVWLGSLGWATWITASATVFGAVLAARLGTGPATRLHATWRLALATSAAVGALLAVALIALPARSAVRTDSYPPQVIAGGYALLGVVLGLVVAYWAVLSRPVAANLMITGVWLWALATVAIVVDLTLSRPSATYLTSWQFAEPAGGGGFGAILWPSALLTLAAALLIGILAATPAVRRGNLGLGTAASGTVGPLVVAMAFLALAPQLTGTPSPLESAYLIAPYAVLAGLAGSALAVAAGRATAARRARRPADDDERAGPAGSADRIGTARTSPGGRRSIPAQADPNSPSAVASLPARSGRAGKANRAGETDAPSGSRASSLDRAGEAGRADPVEEVGSAADPASGREGLLGAGESTRAGDSIAASRSGQAGEPGRTGDPERARGNTAVPAADGAGASRAISSRAKAPSATGRVRPATSRPTPDKSNIRGNDDPAVAAGGSSRPDEGNRGGGPRGTSAAGKSDNSDAETTAPTRPTRERAKKTAPARKTAASPPSRSTVTPPPADPTVAQINPKPSPED